MFDFLKSSLEVIPQSYVDGLLAFKTAKKLSPGKTVKLKLLFVSDGEPQAPVVHLIVSEVEPSENGYLCKGPLKAKDSEIQALLELLMKSGLPGACRRASRRIKYTARILSRQLPNFRGVSVDISQTGLLLIAEGPIEPGTPLNLEFDLEAINEGKLTIQVTSIWSVQEPDEKSVHYRVGVALTQQRRATHEAWERLYQFMAGTEEGSVMQRTISGSVAPQSANVSTISRDGAERRPAPPPPPPQAAPSAPPAPGFAPAAGPPAPGFGVPNFAPPFSSPAQPSAPAFSGNPPAAPYGQKSDMARLGETQLPEGPFSSGFGTQQAQGPLAQRRLKLSESDEAEPRKPHPVHQQNAPYSKPDSLRLPDQGARPGGLNLPSTPAPGFGQPAAGGFTPPPSPGFGQPAAGGFTPPPSPGFGQPAAGGFTPPPSPGFGQPAAGGFTPPPAPGFGQPAAGGFTPPPAPGFGQPAAGGFTPPPAPGFGQPAAGGFTPPPAPGFGQPAAGGFTPPPAPGFGQPAAGGFTPPPAPGFGQPAAGGFAPPPAPTPGPSGQGFTPPPAPGFGTPGQGFTPPPAPSFGQQNQGFTPPPAPSFGQQNQGFAPPPAPNPGQGFVPPPPPNFGQ